MALEKADCNACRLCFSTGNYQFMNIFSAYGIELKIAEIISEHFKCEVSSTDSLPKCVCQICWQITDAFHTLYQKSKSAQANLLHLNNNPTIEEDVETAELCQESIQYDFIELPEIHISSIKSEIVAESSDDELDTRENLEGAEKISDIDTQNDHRNADNNTEVEKTVSKKSKPPRQTARGRRKVPTQKEIDFVKLFAENKHRFNMSCDLCPKIFDSIDEARRHYATAHKNPKGYIKCCNAKLTYRSDISKHINHHINLSRSHPHDKSRQDFICDICKKAFTSVNGIKKHLKLHSKIENSRCDTFIAENFDMSCDQCDAVFVSLHEARLHYKESHKYLKGYIKCCNKKFSQSYAVTDHVKSHLNPSIKCDMCDKRFSSRIQLMSHIHRHKRSMKRSFICDICGKACTAKSSILIHLYSAHVDMEPKFECKFCDKRFRLAALLKNHVYRAHREKKPILTCEICGKTFNVKAHFDAHMITHMDKAERLAQGKPCEHCGEWIVSKSAAYYHEQIHSEGSHKCDKCPMILPNKIALLVHIRKCHKQRNYICSFCNKSFQANSKMKKHEEIHTRHNVYPCQFCDKQYTLPASRITHQTRSHPEELKQLRESRKRMKRPS